MDSIIYFVSAWRVVLKNWKKGLKRTLATESHLNFSFVHQLTLVILLVGEVNKIAINVRE